MAKRIRGSFQLSDSHASEFKHISCWHLIWPFLYDIKDHWHVMQCCKALYNASGNLLCRSDSLWISFESKNIIKIGLKEDEPSFRVDISNVIRRQIFIIGLVNYISTLRLHHLALSGDDIIRLDMQIISGIPWDTLKYLGLIGYRELDTLIQFTKFATNITSLKLYGAITTLSTTSVKSLCKLNLKKLVLYEDCGMDAPSNYLPMIPPDVKCSYPELEECHISGLAYVPEKSWPNLLNSNSLMTLKLWDFILRPINNSSIPPFLPSSITSLLYHASFSWNKQNVIPVREMLSLVIATNIKLVDLTIRDCNPLPQPVIDEISKMTSISTLSLGYSSVSRSPTPDYVGMMKLLHLPNLSVIDLGLYGNSREQTEMLPLLETTLKSISKKNKKASPRVIVDHSYQEWLNKFGVVPR